MRGAVLERRGCDGTRPAVDRPRGPLGPDRTSPAVPADGARAGGARTPGRTRGTSRHARGPAASACLIVARSRPSASGTRPRASGFSSHGRASPRRTPHGRRACRLVPPCARLFPAAPTESASNQGEPHAATERDRHGVPSDRLSRRARGVRAARMECERRVVARGDGPLADLPEAQPAARVLPAVDRVSQGCEPQVLVRGLGTGPGAPPRRPAGGGGLGSDGPSGPAARPGPLTARGCKPPGRGPRPEADSFPQSSKRMIRWPRKSRRGERLTRALSIVCVTLRASATSPENLPSEPTISKMPFSIPS